MKILFMDTETTGLIKPDLCDLDEQPFLIEFAGIILELNNDEFTKHSELQFLCKPPFPISPKIEKITGIKNDDLRNKPRLSDIYLKLKNFIQSADIVVGHNIAFDRAVIEVEIIRMGDDPAYWLSKKFICTAEASMKILGKRWALAQCFQHFYKKSPKVSHRAMDDTVTLIYVFNKLMEEKIIDISRTYGTGNISNFLLATDSHREARNEPTL